MVTDSSLAISQSPQVIRPQAQVVAQQQPMTQEPQADYYSSETSYAPEQKRGGINPVPILILATLATWAGIATGKTMKLSKIFKEAKKENLLPDNSELAKGKVFFQNLNPFNWFDNARTAKKLTDAGYENKKEAKIFQNSDKDIVILNGNAPLKTDSQTHEEAKNIIKDKKADASDVKSEDKTKDKTDPSKTPEPGNKTPENPEEPKISPEEKKERELILAKIKEKAFEGAEIEPAEVPSILVIMSQYNNSKLFSFTKRFDNTDLNKADKAYKALSEITQPNEEPMKISEVISKLGLSEKKQKMLKEAYQREVNKAQETDQKRLRRVEILLETFKAKYDKLDKNSTEAKNTSIHIEEIQKVIDMLKK